MTPLDKTLKRLLNVKGTEYVLTLSPEALKLTRKGKRLGLELKWADITSGESALAVALRASVGRFEPEANTTPANIDKGPKPANIGKGPRPAVRLAKPGSARIRRSAQSVRTKRAR